MSVTLNHTIVHSRDKEKSSKFLAGILGLPEPASFGPFRVVGLSNGVSLDFLEQPEGDITIEHYAFLIGEDEFDEIFGRIRGTGVSSTGPTRPGPGRARSTATTGGAASTSGTPIDTCSRS